MWTDTQQTEDSTKPLNPRQQVIPRPGRHRRPMTAQKPQKSSPSNWKRVLLTVITVIVVLGILATAVFFTKQLIETKYFFCARSMKFIPLDKACDGIEDCTSGEDEVTCVSSFHVNSTFPVRLVSDKRIMQVYSKGLGWRSMCSDDWTKAHTQAACQQLGYTNNPRSTAVPVSELTSSLKRFTATRPAPGLLPLHLNTIDRKECQTRAVISLTCSECGKPGAKDRIVGGTDAFIEDWPWQVSLQQSGQHTCGGSLVSPRWVVTAAHCFTGAKKEVSRWRVVSGRTYMGTLGSSYVDRIIVNADYNVARNDYDIAMMRLYSPITVGDTRLPACLPPKNLALAPGDNMAVTGWGYLDEKGKISPSLQKATIPLIAREQCSKPTVYGSAITPRMICAGYLEGKVDACQGDSGGPLVYFSSSRWNLVGVVSWGVGCAREGRPGVYANIDELLNWIHTVIEKYS